MKDVCYIVGAGQCEKLYINEENKAYVIAADGGMKYLFDAEIPADMVIGDFDSLKYVPKHHNLITLPTKKDVTDMYAAVNEGMNRGYTKFIIYGGLGGRFDHSIANCQLLNHIAENGCVGIIVEKDYAVTVICNEMIKFNSEFKGMLSVFASGDKAKGVTIEGLKYQMTDGELNNTYPLGVSNEFVGQDGLIKVKDGKLLIIFEATPEMVCEKIDEFFK